jgi:hypothetical protein
VFVIRPHWFLPLHYQSIWEPLTAVPLKGIYDDYGALGNIDVNPAIQMQHKTLIKLAQEFPEETRKRHWEIFKEYPDDLSAVYKLCERGVLEVFTPHGNHFSAPFYVREDAYQHVIGLVRGEKDYRGDDIVERVEAGIAAQFNYQVQWHEYLREGKETGEYDHKRMAEIGIDRDELVGGSPSRYLASELIRDHEDRIFADEEARRSLHEAMVEFELFCSGMDFVGVRWQPKTVRGQDEDYIAHAKWHRAVAEMADEAHRRLEDDF